MKISKIMSKNVVVVKMDDRLSRLKELFDQTGFHHLLVVEDERLFGVISDRDLLKSISPNIDTIAATTKDLASLNKRAHQIMTRKPISLTADSTVREAVDIFNSHKISCIPIVNEAQRPIGILSWRDIMREIGRPR
ncbi:CBS domain-containing protein [Gilvimarinus polysaccharolyticus]|uniref:CBS domain-containing protein n=1 Tax=Gilvimarinus polysaccharolyticus TaxID=863921 RepID=UPI0006738BD3|nr:CBS domain-containing protein [Gilvimarinus polysaccharolyticus]